jgi:hypothetical protein
MGRLIYKGINNYTRCYGVIGEETSYTYEDGSPIHIGDIIRLYTKDMVKIKELSVVAKTDVAIGAIGILNSGEIKFGKTRDGWAVKLVKKYYEVEDGYKIRHMTFTDIEPKPQNKKEKIMNNTQKKKVDIQNLKDELIITTDNTTIYYNKDFETIGISHCHPDDEFNSEIGLALAYFRAMRGDE